MSRNKHYIFLGFLVLALCVSAEPAFAQANVAQSARGQLGWSVHDLLLKLSAINTFMHILLLITLNFAQYLIQSDFFTNPAMMGALNKIWQLSRDIMNVAFALMLVGTAIYTIVTAKKDFAMGKISQFVIAVILVNFSWFIPRVIIDVSNIMTATVYTVPKMLGTFTCKTFPDGPNGPAKECTIMEDIYTFGDEAEHARFCGAAYKTDDCPCQVGIGCYKMANFSTVAARGSSTSHVMLNGLVINFAKILSLTKIPDTVAGPQPLGSKEGFYVNLQILMSVMTALVIQLGVLLPLIGLVVGLFLRIIILWITVAFMPFVFLGYVINGKIGTNVFEFEIDLWKEFINAAFLPTFVAIPITIGFVMLTTTVDIPPPPGFFELKSPLIQGMSWWGMLWMVAAIGILWKGAFTALSKSKLVGGFTDKIKGFGEYMFGTALQIPLLTPLPFPGSKGNLGSIVHGPMKFAEAIRSSARTGIPLSESLKNLQPGRVQKDIDTVSKQLSADEVNRDKIIAAIDRLKADPSKKNEVAHDIREIVMLPADATPTQVLERLKQIASNEHAPEQIRNELETLEKLLKGNPPPANPPPANPPNNK